MIQIIKNIPEVPEILVERVQPLRSSSFGGADKYQISLYLHNEGAQVKTVSKKLRQFNYTKPIIELTTKLIL